MDAGVITDTGVIADELADVELGGLGQRPPVRPLGDQPLHRRGRIHCGHVPGAPDHDLGKPSAALVVSAKLFAW